jgi:hypothetical protein
MDPRSVVSAWRASTVALVVLLAPAPVMADRHTGDAGGGGGRSGRSAVWGVNLSGSFVPHRGEWPCGGHELSTSKVKTHRCTLSLAGEVGWAQGDHEGGTLTQWTFLAGPRFTLNPHPRFQPFLVALAGATHEKLRGVGDGSFSTALGAGVDVPFSAPEHPVWVVRGQGTWNWIHNGRSDDSYWQIGVSILYRFGEEDPRRGQAATTPAKRR